MSYRLIPVTRENYKPGELVVVAPIRSSSVTSIKPELRKSKLWRTLDQYEYEFTVADNTLQPLQTSGHKIQQQTTVNKWVTPASTIGVGPYSNSNRQIKATWTLEANEDQDNFHTNYFYTFIDPVLYFTEEEVSELETYALLKVDEFACVDLYLNQVEMAETRPPNKVSLQNIQNFQNKINLINKEAHAELFYDVQVKFNMSVISTLLTNPKSTDYVAHHILCYVEPL